MKRLRRLSILNPSNSRLRRPPHGWRHGPQITPNRGEGTKLHEATLALPSRATAQRMRSTSVPFLRFINPHADGALKIGPSTGSQSRLPLYLSPIALSPAEMR